MSALKNRDPKDYVDRGVQTYSTLWLARPISNLVKASGARTPDSSVPSPSIATPTLSNSSSNKPHAYSHTLPSESPSPAHSATRWIANRQQTPYNHPKFQVKNKRIFSLPVDSVAGHATEIFRSSTPRIVSLPTRLLSSSSSPESSSSSDEPLPTARNLVFVEADSNPAPRLLLRRYPDTPHTPSPPSSPESILIIENKNQLPKTFLRSNSTRDACKDDDGWITWANSPPRPIPALHGPLSLPYARCPSGAEGTIIGENDNLPRMIWGLGPDDALSTHSRASSHNPVQTIPHTNLPHNICQAGPPRLQKPRPVPEYLATPQQTPKFSSQVSHCNISSGDRQDIIHRRALENLGSRTPRESYNNCVALNNMLQDGTAEVAGTWDALYGHPGYQFSDMASRNVRASELDKAAALDWHSALFQQQKLKQALMDGKYRTKDPHYLKPSATVFVPSNQSAPLPYPRIFVEPRPVRSYQATKPSSPTHMYQHSLPTPPSSSSPQWSAKFSPYQNSSYSPEMARPRQFGIPVNATHQTRHVPDSSSELRKFVYERIGNRGSKNISLPLLSDQIVRPQIPPDPIRFARPEQLIASLTTAPHPGPPPSTPLPPLPLSPPILRVQQPATNVTPSVSSEIRSRSTSYQHPRSVPLSRLIERRLSSVPEEDYNSFIERNRTPSSPISPQQPRHSPAISHVSVYPHQQQTPLLSGGAWVLSPDPNNVGLKSMTTRDTDPLELFGGELGVSGTTGAAGSGSKPAPVKVRLPSPHSGKLDREHIIAEGMQSEGSKENSARTVGVPGGRKRGRAKKNKLPSLGAQPRAPVRVMTI